MTIVQRHLADHRFSDLLLERLLREQTRLPIALEGWDRSLLRVRRTHLQIPHLEKGQSVKGVWVEYPGLTALLTALK